MAAAWYQALHSGNSRYGLPPTIASSPAPTPSLGSAPSKPQGYQPRGFPEAIQLEDYVPEQATGEMGGIGGAIDTAMRAPAYVAERPFAFVDTLAQSTGVTEEGRGLFDPVAEGIRGLPFIGEHLSNAGDLTMNAFEAGFDAVGAVNNAQWAAAIASGSDRNAAVDAGGLLGLTNEAAAALITGHFDAFAQTDKAFTMGDLEDWLLERGWTQQDFNDIRSGKKGWLDFGKLQIPEQVKGLQAWNDFATRMALDPTNLMFGVGALSKAGKVFHAGVETTRGIGRATKAVSAGENVSEAFYGGTKAERTMSKAMQLRATRVYAERRAGNLFTHKALPINAGVQEMAKGSLKGVTQQAAAKFIRGYRYAAYGSTGLQVGLNTIDQVVNGDREPQDGWMGNVFDFARKWGDNKPLSKNDLFSLYMIMKVPGRTMASAAWKPVKGKLNARRKFPQQNTFVEILAPELVESQLTKGKGGGKSYVKAREAVVERLGGEVQFEAAFYHVLRAALHKKNFLEGTPSLPKLFHVTSLFESGAIVERYSRMMDGFVKEALEEGSLNADDIRRAMEDFAATRGGTLDDLTKGVEGQFRPDDFFETWQGWERLATASSTAFQNGKAVAPGLTADIVTTDGIEWLLANIDVMKTTGGKINGQQLMDLLRFEPAVFNFPGGREFARVLTRNGIKESYDVARVRKWLNEVKADHAISRHEYVAPYEEWGRLAQANERGVLYANSRYAEDGVLPDDITDLPNSTTATIPAANASAVRASQAEVGGAGMGVIRHQRNTTEGQAFRYNVVAGLNLAGYGIRSAVDSVFLIGGRHGANGMATAGINIRMAAGRPVQDGLNVVAMGLERSAAGRGTLTVRGANEIKAAGWVDNADELTYHVGNRTEGQWDDLINKLNDEWGDRITINDTNGTVRILVPDEQTRGITSRLERADKLLGGKRSSERVAYRDIIKRKSDAPRGSKNTILIKDQLASARLRKQYHIANDYIELGVGGYANAGSTARGARSAKAATAPDGSKYSLGPDGSTQYSQPTRWEADNGGRVRGSSSEHLVPGLGGKATAERWTDKIRNAGVVVRADGEVIPWRGEGPGPAPGDWGEVLAESTREGTWSRFIDEDGPGGHNAIDVLSEHGYVPFVRGRVTTGNVGDDLVDVVYMVFDPDDTLGLALNGRSWKQAKTTHQSMRLRDPQQARQQTVGYVESLHPERAARQAQATVDGALLAKQRRLAELDTEIAAKQNELNLKEQARVRPVERAPTADPSVASSNTKQVAGDTIANGGATVDAVTLEPWTGGGYSVASTKGTAELLPLSATEDEIAAAIQKVRDEYPSAEHIGTWKNENPADGAVGYHIDPATIRTSRRDAEILAQQTDQIAIFDLNTFEDILTPTVPINAAWTRSSSYRKLIAERDQLLAETSTTAARARQAAIDERAVNPGSVLFVEGAERQVDNFRVRLDESIEGNLDSLPPGEIEKLYQLEAQMKLTGSYVNAQGKVVDSANYRLKRLPDQATPYRGAQAESEAYRAIVQGRLAAEDGWRTFTTSKLAQAQSLMFGRVYAVELQREMRQEVYNEFLAQGATAPEVNRFLKALQAEWENQFSIGGARVFRSADMMPKGGINKLARGQRKDSLVFSKGFKGEWAQNVDVADMMQRASSRTFRNLSKKYPAQDGRGNLGRLIEVFYGKQAGRGGGTAKIARTGAYAGSVGYTVLRFILDPRWYLMNALESDILGMARWGSKVRGVMGGKARGTGIIDHMKGVDPAVPRDPFVERMSARRKDSTLLSVDEILHANAGASGWMDPRNLYGYVALAAQAERPVITGKLFQQMIDEGSPVIDDLRARWGDNQQSWFDEIDELLYSIDKKGARRTVLDNELAKQMMNDPVNSAVYEEFLTNLWKQQRQMFKDVTHTFHGNVNRSNIERLVNSPLLWWPISYQLKTGKWLIDVMTKSFMGNKAELAGTAVLGKLLANHQWSMENNDEYRNTFDQHPALFRALSMMLPITPFDFGVFMARWSRYAGSWTGAQLELWDQDTSYPQDPINFMARSLSLGPIYSWDLVGDILREFESPKGSKFQTQLQVQ